MNELPAAVSGIDPDATFQRAVALYHQQNIAQAVASCESVLGSQPDHLGALRLLGSALLQLNRPQDALVTLDRALRRNSGCDELHYNRGNALRQLNRYEDAVHAY